VTTILLARHGETDWNASLRWQGHADPGLNEAGRRQAHELAARLARERLDAIYASDLVRARETAEIVAADTGLPVRALAALREIDVGEWSGLTTPEIERLYPDGMHRHRAGGDGWERGETHVAMTERVIGAVTAIAAEHPSERLLLVGHGGTIRALLAHAEGVALTELRLTRPPPANGSLAVIAVEDGIFSRLE
jgi:broad specificity phosphatase PhoE